MNETGFNHQYPARVCPLMPNPRPWLEGYARAVDLWYPRATANPFPHCSAEWLGYEFGVYERELKPA